jgi:cell division protein FtsL
MTAQPLRQPLTGRRFRVIAGRTSRRRLLAPWVVFTVVAVAAFLGMVLTRTALDRSAIELASIQRQIADAKSTNQLLRLEIGRLESPARIAPLAAEMGMVYPPHTEKLMVAGVIPDGSTDPRWADLQRLSVAADPEGPEEWASGEADLLAAGPLDDSTETATATGGTTP